MAVGKESLVEIQYKTLAGGIGNGPHTKQWSTALGGEFSHRAGFHFDGGRTAAAQQDLLGGSLGHTTDGGEHARGMGRIGTRQAHLKPAAGGFYRGCHENIANAQRRIQRSTESHTDNRFGVARGGGYLNCPARMRRARAIGHHPKLPAAGLSESGPTERPRRLSHL
jgi:hypothetical protein